MTNGDVLVSVLAEVTGQPAITFEPVLRAVRALTTDHRLDEELTDAEASALLVQLRKERGGILAWCRGGVR